MTALIAHLRYLLAARRLERQQRRTEHALYPPYGEANDR